MNMTSLIVGFILGVVSTFIFTYATKSSADKASSDQASGEKLSLINRLKANPLLGVFILVPILAGLIYWKAGNPEVPSVNVSAKTMSAPMGMDAPPPMGENHEMGDLGAMAQKLAAKLEKIQKMPMVGPC
jgi:hypothetical protein